MSIIQLVPIIELPAAAVDPEHSWHAQHDRSVEEIELITTLIRAFEDVPRIDGLPHFVWASSMRHEHWRAITRSHVSVLENLEDTCALFGGYGLKIDGVWRLLPQCCATLAEIKYWKQVGELEEVPAKNAGPLERWFGSNRTRPARSQSVWLAEGHPSAEIYRCSKDVVFDCTFETDEFRPRTEPKFSVDFESLKSAIRQAIQETDQIERQLELVADEFGVPSLRALVYEFEVR